MTCAACGTALAAVERVGRRDTCPRCGADLHSCRQCRFHDARVYNECHEPLAERVLDKTRSNFCEYFAPPDGAPDRTGSSVRPAPPGTGHAPVPGAGGRDELERLFRRR